LLKALPLKAEFYYFYRLLNFWYAGKINRVDFHEEEKCESSLLIAAYRRKIGCIEFIVEILWIMNALLYVRFL
jgi:hypothetical protein